VAQSGPSAPVVVGIDLAWGHRSPTGVAVARFHDDGVARVETLTAVRTDADLDTLLGAALAGACVVGIDAPLRVENPTGRRPCEALMSRAFAPEHAGVYPSNTGLSHFADGGRGAAFARRHGLPIDGRPAHRRALEVFPHSVAVAVFDLERVLPYKARRGRTLDSRRAALLRLVGLVAGLDDPPPGLPRFVLPHGLLTGLSEAITGAATGAALRREEDPVDALLCAYAAVLHLAGRTVVLGEPATGVIVTPVRGRHLQRLGLPIRNDQMLGP
jgi:predicted RNase H-like nuclease